MPDAAHAQAPAWRTQRRSATPPGDRAGRQRAASTSALAASNACAGTGLVPHGPHLARENIGAEVAFLLERKRHTLPAIRIHQHGCARRWPTSRRRGANSTAIPAMEKKTRSPSHRKSASSPTRITAVDIRPDGEDQRHTQQKAGGEVACAAGAVNLRATDGGGKMTGIATTSPRPPAFRANEATAPAETPRQSPAAARSG